MGGAKIVCSTTSSAQEGGFVIEFYLSTELYARGSEVRSNTLHQGQARKG